MPVQRVNRSLLTIAFVFATLLVAAVLAFRHHVEGTLSRAAVEVRQSKELAFTLKPLALPPNPGFTSLSARADFRSAAVVGDQLFLAGPGELLQLADSGATVRTYHAGSELPGFPLGPMAAGRLHGYPATQLLVGTAGAGLLILQPGSGKLKQLLPSKPELRDLTAVAALPDGDVLLGTRRHGVLRYDGDTLSLYRPEYHDVAVTALLASAGTVWVGTQADGLFITRAGVTQHLQPELPDPHIEALAAHGNRVFAATPNGVAEFVEGRFERTLAPGIFAHTLFPDDKELTVATFEGDVLTVPLGAAHAPISPVSETTQGETQQFVAMPDGLYAVRADGLFRRRGARWTSAVASPSTALTDRNIAALAFAPDGSLWVGYFDHGLDILPANGGGTRHLEDDHLFCTNRIAVDPNRGTMAVATANGLVLFDRGGMPRQVLGVRDGLISEHVTDIAWSGDTMALATPAGLTFVSKDGVESLYAFQGLVNNHVYSIASSPDGHLLAGTLGGLSVLDHASVRGNLTVSNSSLRHNWVSAVLALPSSAGGGYLVGTYGGGLMRLTGGSGSAAQNGVQPGSQISAMPGAPADAVINPNALLATPAHVFAGSLGQGLWYLSRDSARWRQITAGLPSLNVTALAAHNGDLFVGTDNGLVHILEANLHE